MINWVRHELLGRNSTFSEFGGKVPVPWPSAADQLDDQLDNGQFVAYSRRQVCFIVAKSLVGADTMGYRNGLHRYLEAHVPWEGCTPWSSAFGRAFWGLLKACAADPALTDGAQGPSILVAKAMKPPKVEDVRKLAKNAMLADADLRVCRYDDGSAGVNGTLPAPLKPVPVAGCMQPLSNAPGKDFMTGGLRGQATADISASWLGGYIMGNSCGLAAGQDERLMSYMPEVAALAFFLSQSPKFPQLRQPAWVLGARMLFKGIDGTSRFDHTFEWDPAAPLSGDLIATDIQGARYALSSSRPFIAFMSESQDFFGGDWTNKDKLQRARRNKEPLQRVWFHPAGSLSKSKCEHGMVQSRLTVTHLLSDLP